MSWNINSVRTKMEKMSVRQMLANYDVIGLNEVKTNEHVHFPGYVTFRSKATQSSNRGGTVVLVRNCIAPFVYEVDTSVNDQVWLQFRNMYGVLFGFIYVPPSDSQYYSHESFAAIQGKIKAKYMCNGYIMMGDMNARFGKRVREILPYVQEQESHPYSYPHINDDVNVANDNAEVLSSICMNNKLLVLNNLKTCKNNFVSDKTYRKRDVWISELDVCIVSPQLLDSINDFSVMQRIDLPSDHAPITATVNVTGVDLDNLSVRASTLGGHAVLLGTAGRSRLVRKPVRFCEIDKENFVRHIAQQMPCIQDDDVNSYVNNLSDTLYTYAKSSVVLNEEVSPVSRMELGRWERLMEDDDDARVWKAIDWKGNYSTSTHSDSNLPSDAEFRDHFEKVLNPARETQNDLSDLSTDINIPVLDEPISPLEVQNQIKRMKVNKACGPDGIPPGVFSLMSPQWLVTIATLFSCIFSSAMFPYAWIRAKVFVIFKKGDKTNTDNYRGISVINSIAKLYEMVLCERLNQWFKPDREQAGAQKKRGCIEHIVTLRLLTNTARLKKIKLFVVFIDFSKAYDIVPRKTLFTVMKGLGCGAVMLAAMVAMYRTTESVIGAAVLSASQGVRQGSPTSCFLFVMFVNMLIRSVKEKCRPEVFIEWLKILMFMDDTVLLSTSRENMYIKLRILQEYCKEYGMRINSAKTKFFVINGGLGDKEPFSVGGTSMKVEHCDSYMYLGSPFTCDGSVSSAVKVHAKNKLCHVLKFISFLKKNNDIPFIVKRRVFDAALLSSLVYGCESWIDADVKPVVKLYNWALKQLLGVRKTTPNVVCYVESGYPSLPDLVKYRQHKFLKKMWDERSSMNDDPLSFAMRKVINENTNMGKCVKEMIRGEVPDMSVLLEKAKCCIRDSGTSRCIVYKDINPTLSTHEIYTKRQILNEFHRLEFTRFRLSGHTLAIETGRWNRRGRGRLPLEERLCSCGEIQTERHVLENCTLTQHLRNNYRYETMEDVFTKCTTSEMCNVIFDVLKVYK